MRELRLTAHAKLNLTLDVVGRRADGFHELRSVMARISFADDVRVARARRWHVVVRPAPVELPPGGELAERAARSLARRLGRADAAAIVVRKRVPPASGLGGGSSDAAHVLRGLGALWDAEERVLHEVARDVGSDVPFFLDGALAEIRGRGDELRGLIAGPWYGVLVLAPCRISTAEAFARLESDSWSDGARSAALVRAIESRAADAASLRALCGNDLDRVAVSLCPEIATIRKSVAFPLFLSGSGPSLFAIGNDWGHSLVMTRKLRRSGWRTRPILIGVVP